MSAKRISTGIPELDSMTEGGLRAGKTYLVVGSLAREDGFRLAVPGQWPDG